ncbi:MAG TPA: glycosyltransferase 87 family protein [Candidatus Limnocylindrales bacterium]|nr:glycosyltransferase 87 family protein [Candidatus Limnocylindrales bacterium]
MTVRALAIVAAATFAAVVLYLIGWPASQYVHVDFAGFWVGSRMLLEGADPYDFAAFLEMHQRIGSRGLAINPPGTAYGYPLTTAVIFAPFALLPVSAAAPIWLVTQAALSLSALVTLFRRLVGADAGRHLPILLALALASQAAWLLAAGGNLGGYLLAIAATCASLLLAGRPSAAGAVAGLFVIKPHPMLIALVLLLLVLPRRDALRFAIAGASVAGVVVVVALALRPAWIGEFLVPFARIGGAPVPRATLFGLVGSTLGPATWIVVALIAAAYLWWARTTRSLPFRIAAAIPISLFCIPYGWSYDHLLLVVPLAVIVATIARHGARFRLAVLAALGMAFVLVPWTLYVIAFRRGDESWSAFVPVAMLATLALVIWHDARTHGGDRYEREASARPPRHAHS